jgi:hypothetical protein
LKLHKDLDKDKPYLKGKPSEERCVIQEEVKLLWKKIVAYEYYGNSERNLRNKAVEALNRLKTQILEGEGESFEKKEKGNDPKSKQRKTPKVMLMRAAPLEELEDQKLIDLERRGSLLDEEYERLLEENEI